MGCVSGALYTEPTVVYEGCWAEEVDWLGKSESKLDGEDGRESILWQTTSSEKCNCRCTKPFPWISTRRESNKTGVMCVVFKSMVSL